MVYRVIHQVPDKRFASDCVCVTPANRGAQVIAMNPMKEVIGVLRLPHGDEDVRVERVWSGDLLVTFAHDLLRQCLRQAADEALIS